MTIITTPEGIAFFQLITLRGRLKIEIATGLRHSGGSTLAVVNRVYATNFKRKAQALEFLEARIAEAKEV